MTTGASASANAPGGINAFGSGNAFGSDCLAGVRVSGGNPPLRTFPSKGGGLSDYVYTSRATPELWRRLLVVIGREDVVGVPPLRHAHRPLRACGRS